MAPNTNIKSIRIDEELIKKIGKDINFSNFVNQALREYLGKSVWIPNFEIERHAGITPQQLIERVQNIQFLRFSENSLSFTFYPTSEDEISQNKRIFDYANGIYNSIHDRFIYFNLKFPVNLLLFLKSRSWEEVNRCITGFLSLTYWLEEDKRNILEAQLEKKILKAVTKTVQGQLFSEMKSVHKEYSKKWGADLRAKYNSSFFNLVISLGIDPIVFPYMKSILSHIQYPLHLHSHISFEKTGDFGIKIPAGYMREIYEKNDDWSLIVVAGERGTDNLHRAESEAEPWISWKQEYTFYHHLSYE